MEHESGTIAPKVGPQMPEIGVGVGVLVLAAIVGWQTSQIAASTYAKVSPSLVPWGITGALALLGSLLIIAGIRGGWPHEHGWDLDWKALLWLAVGMTFNVAFIEGVGEPGSKIIPPFGFIICSIVLFTCVARAFGSTKVLRDIVLAAVFATIAYAGFDGILGYKIGAGGLDHVVSSTIDTLYKMFVGGAR